jgi:predicted negative regulator of RcsB-dependent stress response
MRKARAVLRDDIPTIEKQLTVLERTGVAQVECEGPAWSAGLDKLAAAVDRPYQAVPKELRQDVEFAMRREDRALRRGRESISMDRSGPSRPII